MCVCLKGDIAMAKQDRREKGIQKTTTTILEEAQPYLVGEPHVWRKQLFEDVTLGETLTQQLKASIPLMKGRLRPDLMIIHDLPTDLGIVHCVIVYSGYILLPTEFIMTIDGRIPHAVFLKRAMLGTGTWTSEHDNEYDKETFCAYLNEINYRIPNKKKEIFGKLEYAADWNQDVGRGKIKLIWSMQLVPFDEKFIYIFQYPQQIGGWNKWRFGIDKFVELSRALKSAIDDYRYAGPKTKTELLYPTIGLLSVSELMEDQKVEELKDADEIPEREPNEVKAESVEVLPIPEDDDIIAIVKKRLASGEISVEEYERIMNALEK